MTTDDAERSQRLVIDVATFRKDKNANSETLSLKGTYPASQAKEWEHRLHPARIFGLLDRDATNQPDKD